MSIMLSPFIGILTVINTFMLVLGQLRNVFPGDDNFLLKIEEHGKLIFYNKGKNNIDITEISIWAETGEPIIENLHPDAIKVFGRDKKIIRLFFETREFNEAKEKYEKIFLCFDIKSASGENYDQLAYKLLDKNRNIKFGKTRLTKELVDIIDEPY